MLSSNTPVPVPFVEVEEFKVRRMDDLSSYKQKDMDMNQCMGACNLSPVQMPQDTIELTAVKTKLAPNVSNYKLRQLSTCVRTTWSDIAKHIANYQASIIQECFL